MKKLNTLAVPARLKKAALGLAVAGSVAFGFSAPAQAIDIIGGGGVNINQFDVNNFKKDGTTTLELVKNVGELTFQGWSLSDFGSGDPNSTGATFRDYIVVSVTGFKREVPGQNIGSQVNTQYEITATIVADGKITDGTTGAFQFTNLVSFEVLQDDWTALIPDQQGAFDGTQAQFDNFFDGRQVLTGGALTCVTPGCNAGNAGAANGAFVLNFTINEGSTPGWLREFGTTNSLFSAFLPASIVLLPDGDLTVEDPSSTNGTNVPNVVSNFANHFGFDPTRVTLAVVSSDGTNDVGAVPEPTVMSLLGVGLLGLGFSRRRRNA